VGEESDASHVGNMCKSQAPAASAAMHAGQGHGNCINHTRQG
jgi:hypothetical protein